MGRSFETFSALSLVQPPNPAVGSYNVLNLRGAYRFWQQKAKAGYLREGEVAVSAFNALIVPALLSSGARLVGQTGSRFGKF